MMTQVDLGLINVSRFDSADPVISVNDAIFLEKLMMLIKNLRRHNCVMGEEERERSDFHFGNGRKGR
jgi:hypothetical protein